MNTDSKTLSSSTPKDDNDDIDLMALLFAILRGWKTILFFLLIGLLVGVLYSRYVNPTFRSDALIQIEENSQGVSALGASASELIAPQASKAQTEAELIRSRMILEPVVGKVAPVPILDQGLNLAQVIGESAGLNPSTANAAKIYVVRDQPEYQRTNIYYVNMQSLTSFPLANRFDMQPNDIVYVDPTGLARWNRVLSALLPSTSAVRSISTL